jgi:hypothetical protein
MLFFLPSQAHTLFFTDLYKCRSQAGLSLLHQIVKHHGVVIEQFVFDVVVVHTLEQ